jgi:NADH:ubiquinone oxidoreductase subunit 6 (subunit J)
MEGVLSSQWPASLAVAALFFLLLVIVVTPLVDDLGLGENVAGDFGTSDPADVPEDSILTLGERLVDPDYYMLPFEVASVLLMAALIGSVLLVRPDENATDTPRAVSPAAEAGDD